MSGYVQIQWCGKVSSEKHLLDLLDTFKEFLCTLGFTQELLEQWIVKFSWNDLQEFGFAETYNTISVTFEGEHIHIAPNICGFAGDSNTPIGSNWIELNILFRSLEVSVSDTDWRYKASIGRLIWRLLCDFALVFKLDGVFLTDEAGNAEPWYVLMGLEGDIWNFDLALIPLQLKERFSSVPPSHETYHLEQWIGIARSEAWVVLPWK